MWLGLALVVWLWGVALYLAIYYFACWYWHGQLYEVLGQSFYNAHIPGGGWEAAIVPTIVFIATLGIVGAARRPIGAAAPGGCRDGCACRSAPGSWRAIWP
jgi:hypothetical protein